MNRQKKILILFGLLTVISILGYLFFWMLTTEYVLFPSDPIKQEQMRQAIKNIVSRKSYQVLAMVVSAVLIASTTLVFQTLTHNRILTPSLIGFDSMFILSQTAIVFFLSEQSAFYFNPYLNFIATTMIMLLVSFSMFRLILSKQRNNIVFLLLFGMILATLSNSFSSFLQTIMDPDQFQSVAIQTQVTISNMNTSIIVLAVPLMIIVLGLLIKDVKQFDIMSLGETQAINLGINYNKQLNISLIYIAIAMSLSTALIGPISFLGLIAVNAAKELLKTYKHIYLLILSSFIAVISIVVGQTIVIELGYITTVSVVISMIGGIYMIYLILKENKA
ncbi:MAG: iron chelate uptake ABC transporter family permease subunit [Acholeplasmataceae bacterium]|nr:iron chelate uptake ABC transporter family permease subunit [Acholeplasmataceae bacterium]